VNGKNINNKIVQLDIGCGTNKRVGFIGLDILPLPGVDIVANIEDGLPIKTNVVDHIYISHVLEHISKLNDIMDELWRICKKDAIVEIYVPYYKSAGAFQDPTHKRFFSWLSFDYFTNNQFLPHYNLNNNFEIVEKKLLVGIRNWKQFPSIKGKIFALIFLKPLELILNILTKILSNNLVTRLYEDTMLSSILPASELMVCLKVKK